MRQPLPGLPLRLDQDVFDLGVVLGEKENDVNDRWDVSLKRVFNCTFYIACLDSFKLQNIMATANVNVCVHTM